MAGSVGLKAKPLADLLSIDSDIQFQFADSTLPAHSIYVLTASKVLSYALEAEKRSRTDCRSRIPDKLNKHSPTGAITIIPMKGTKKEDWLTALEFLYPVVPTPEVTWDNLEVLPTIGSKFDIPSLLDKAGNFLIVNKDQLTGLPSDRFAWKWITLADKAGIPKVAQACIDAKISKSAVRNACKKEALVGMGPATMQHLLAALAQSFDTAGTDYCPMCEGRLR